MERMTLEKAREIVEQGKIQGYATPIAKGFIEGYESRHAEIEELKIIIKGLQDGWKMTTDAWVKVKE